MSKHEFAKKMADSWQLIFSVKNVVFGAQNVTGILFPPVKGQLIAKANSLVLI